MRIKAIMEMTPELLAQVLQTRCELINYIRNTNPLSRKIPIADKLVNELNRMLLSNAWNKQDLKYFLPILTDSYNKTQKINPIPLVGKSENKLINIIWNLVNVCGLEKTEQHSHSGGGSAAPAKHNGHRELLPMAEVVTEGDDLPKNESNAEPNAESNTKKIMPTVQNLSLNLCIAAIRTLSAQLEGLQSDRYLKITETSDKKIKIHTNEYKRCDYYSFKSTIDLLLNYIKCCEKITKKTYTRNEPSEKTLEIQCFQGDKSGGTGRGPGFSEYVGVNPKELMLWSTSILEDSNEVLEQEAQQQKKADGEAKSMSAAQAAAQQAAAAEPKVVGTLVSQPMSAAQAAARQAAEAAARQAAAEQAAQQRIELNQKKALTILHEKSSSGPKMVGALNYMIKLARTSLQISPQINPQNIYSALSESQKEAIAAALLTDKVPDNHRNAVNALIRVCGAVAAEADLQALEESLPTAVEAHSPTASNRARLGSGAASANSASVTTTAHAGDMAILAP